MNSIHSISIGFVIARLHRSGKRTVDFSALVAYNVGYMADALGHSSKPCCSHHARLQDEAYGARHLKASRSGSSARSRLARSTRPSIDSKKATAVLEARARAPGRAGRARRYYRRETGGLRALNEGRAAVDNIWRGLKWPLVKARSMA